MHLTKYQGGTSPALLSLLSSLQPEAALNAGREPGSCSSLIIFLSEPSLINAQFNHPKFQFSVFSAILLAVFLMIFLAIFSYK